MPSADRLVRGCDVVVTRERGCSGDTRGQGRVRPDRDAGGVRKTMARLSFEKKRDQWSDLHPAAALDVRVSGSGSASVGGVAVVAAPGQEIQQAVLNHLQRLALSLGRSVQ